MNEGPRGSAERVVHLLKLIASGPHHFTLGQLAERAHLPASTVHRLLQSLLTAGIVERGPRQNYRPGRELHRLASQLVGRFDLARSARPLLEELVEQWHETAVLCIYSPTRHRAIIAEAVHSPHALRFNIEQGGEIELPWGSLGKAILAHLPAGEIEAIFRETGCGPLTGRPRMTRDELAADLEAVRKQGVARYVDPSFDLAGIAAPISGADEEILGCIGVIMPRSRYRAHLQDDLGLAVSKAARELSGLAAISHS
jgi:DNA-binding IclR family transcriptional regulator